MPLTCSPLDREFSETLRRKNVGVCRLPAAYVYACDSLRVGSGGGTRSVALLAFVCLLAGCGSGAKSDAGPKSGTTRHAQFGDILDAGSLVGLFQANGLPVGKYQVYNASTDPNSLLGRPGLYTSKSNFTDTRIDQSGFAGEKTIETEQGGSVEVFASDRDARQRADYVRSITRGSALFAEYSYLRDRVFLPLSKRLTPKQARPTNAYCEACLPARLAIEKTFARSPESAWRMTLDESNCDYWLSALG